MNHRVNCISWNCVYWNTLRTTKEKKNLHLEKFPPEAYIISIPTTTVVFVNTRIIEWIIWYSPIRRTFLSHSNRYIRSCTLVRVRSTVCACVSVCRCRQRTERWTKSKMAAEPYGNQRKRRTISIGRKTNGTQKNSTRVQNEVRHTGASECVEMNCITETGLWW